MTLSPSQSRTTDVLRAHGVQPTAQRALVTEVLFRRMCHMSADEVHRELAAMGKRVSKATVYNTLGLLTEKGVVREVIADPARVYYDPNTKPHHHFYCVETGKLSDIDMQSVEVRGLPPIPEGTQLEGIEIIVRLRSTK